MSKSILAVVIAPVVAAVVFSPTAQADRADEYASKNAARVCAVLDSYPSFDGIMGIGQAIVEETGFTYGDAGKIVAESIVNECPRYSQLLKDFIEKYRGKGQVV